MRQLSYVFIFFFKQKTAYEMRISDWSSDVCSSDLIVMEGAQSVATEIGNQASAVYFDAYDQKSVEAMIQTAIDRYGRLDVLVNNVADTSLTTLDGTVLETEIATFDRSIASNLRSIFIATKAALPHLLETKGARSEERRVGNECVSTIRSRWST